MLIRELSKLTGISAKTICFYEEKGLLLPPERTANNYRSYSHDSVRRLRFINSARWLGFSVRDIAEFPSVRGTGEPPCRRALTALETRLAEIDYDIATLQSMRSMLIHHSRKSLHCLNNTPVEIVARVSFPSPMFLRFNKTKSKEMQRNDYQGDSKNVGVGWSCRCVACYRVAFLTSLFAGGFQEPFHVVWSIGEYADMLSSRAMGLRLSFTLDDIFIVVYTSFFILLGVVLRKHGNQTVINLAIGAIVLAGLLDAIENSHILIMMTQVDKGLPILPFELAVQMAASQVKFVSSYFSIFLIWLSFPRTNFLEKMAAWSFIYLQLPLGVLPFTVPREWIPALVIARGVFFIVGFILTSKIFWDRSSVVH